MWIKKDKNIELIKTKTALKVWKEIRRTIKRNLWEGIIMIKNNLIEECDRKIGNLKRELKNLHKGKNSG